MDEHSIEHLTARVQELEQQLELQRIELETAKEDLHSFTYKISHDLHAPLRAISNYIQMIRSDYSTQPLDENGQRMVSRVVSNTEEMKNMLDGLLEFVRIEKKEMNSKPLQMTSLVKEICKNMQEQFPERKLLFHVDELIEGYGDEELIQKVCRQLIANAVKFTSQKEEARIEIFSEEKEGQTVYAIKDNGDGFDMSYYTKLFGVFQRLHHKSDFEGIGIGLAIVSKIIARHKGKVWAEGKVKEGAVFYFSLPERNTYQ